MKQRSPNNEKIFMSRFSKRNWNQLVPSASIVSVLFAVLAYAQVPVDSAPATGSDVRIPVDVFTAPHPRKIESPGDDCAPASAGSRAARKADPACEAFRSLDYGEGWVVLRFMVDPAGKPFEVAVTQSTGNKLFEKAAIDALERSTFEPGTLNGKPVESNSAFKYSFANNTSPAVAGAQPKFIEAYKALGEAISSGDRALADAAMKNLEITNPFEDAYFGVATFSYANKWGTEAEQLAGLRRAIANEDSARYLPSALFRNVSLACFKLELKAHEYGEAFTIWKSLEMIGIDGATAASLKPIIDQLEKIRSDNSEYEVLGSMPNGSWQLHLFKRHFRALINEGRISEVKLLCNAHFLHFAFDPKLQYEVTSKDGDCFLELNGAPGTQFKLIQF